MKKHQPNKGVITPLVFSCFNVHESGHDSWWTVVNVRSFLSFVIFCYPKKGKKEKGKNLRERKKLLFRIGCPKEAGILKSYKNPCPFPCECLRHEETKPRLTQLFFICIFCERREEKRRAEKDRLKCWLAFSESRCQSRSDLFMRRYERVKACEGVRDKREREQEKEKEKGKGCC